jgi:hypothetical protein
MQHTAHEAGALSAAMLCIAAHLLLSPTDNGLTCGQKWFIGICCILFFFVNYRLEFANLPKSSDRSLGRLMQFAAQLVIK